MEPNSSWYIYVLSLAILSIVGMFVCVLKFPKLRIGKKFITTFWIPPLIGGLLILIYAGYDSFFSKITENTSLNPLKILVLFISVSFLSIVLDESGFFKFVASVITKKFKSSQIKLFIVLYVLISILTVFTSNDIVILTFTPFILYLAKRGNINPIPYLVMEFVAANTYSMILEIGNPTNVFLSGAYQIPFLEYTAVMIIPSLLSGIVSFGVIYLMFRKDLKVKMESFDLEVIKIKDKPLCIVSGSILACATILLAVSNYINLEMYIISAGFALLLLLFLIVYSIIKKESDITLMPLRRVPYNLIPFILSMFAIIMGVNKLGLFEALGNSIASINNPKLQAILYLIVSTLSCNIVNNIPMTLAFQSILGMSSPISSVYAVVMGSNIGALLTPIGALAGIMWLKILKDNEIEYGFLDFIKKGSLITLSALIPLAIALLII